MFRALNAGSTVASPTVIESDAGLGRRLGGAEPGAQSRHCSTGDCLKASIGSAHANKLQPNVETEVTTHQQRARYSN